MKKTNDKDRERLALIAEVEALRQRVSELEGRRASSHEDRLKLAIVDGMPLTLWACRRDLTIVLWSGACEGTYSISSDHALEESFVDLFVDDPEKEAATHDTVQIIDSGEVFRNFLAYDKAGSRQHNVMLTNCFRIWDEDTEEWLQAEVGVQINDLKLRRDEHKNLRAVGQERLARQAELLELQRREFLRRLDAAYARRESEIDRDQAEVDEFARGMRERGGRDDGQSVTDPRQKLAAARATIVRRRKQIVDLVAKVKDPAQWEPIEAELDRFADETSAGR